jgi:hypothetical protein
MLDMLTQHGELCMTVQQGRAQVWDSPDMLSRAPCCLQRAGDLGMEGLSARLRGRLAAYVAHVLECSYEVPGALAQPASQSPERSACTTVHPPFQRSKPTS